MKLKPLHAFFGGILIASTTLFSLNYTDSLNTQQKKVFKEPLFFSPPVQDTLTFCGETIPLTDFEVRERYEKELIQAVFQHSTTLLLLKQSKRWKHIVLPILKEQGIHEDFFYLMTAESHFRVQATSNKGAQGLWQFMKSTADYYHLEVNAYVDERNDPIASTYAACKFLKDAYKKLNNWCLVAAAYNRGLNGLLIDMNAQKTFNYPDLFLNSETSRYLFRIIALKNLMEAPEKFGYQLSAADYYDTIPYRTVQVAQTIPDLVAFAKSHNTTFKHLKTLNPWLVSNSLPIINNKSYTIRIPIKKQ